MRKDSIMIIIDKQADSTENTTLENKADKVTEQANDLKSATEVAALMQKAISEPESETAKSETTVSKPETAKPETESEYLGADLKQNEKSDLKPDEKADLKLYENDPELLTKLEQKGITKLGNDFDFDIMITDYAQFKQLITKWLKEYQEQDQERDKDFDSLADCVLTRNYDERQDLKRFLNLRSQPKVLPALNFANAKYLLAVVLPKKQHLVYLYPLNRATLAYIRQMLNSKKCNVKNKADWQNYLERLTAECAPIDKQYLDYDLAQFEQLDQASYGDLGIYKFNASGYVCHDTALQSDDHWREID